VPHNVQEMPLIEHRRGCGVTPGVARLHLHSAPTSTLLGLVGGFNP